jgi:hypothetical protein
MSDLPETLQISLAASEESMAFRRIRAASFRMGERGGFEQEEPVHRVTIPQDYYLGVFPVTQAQFGVWTASQAYREWFRKHASTIRETSPFKVAAPHRNHFGDPARPRHPAENVTWWEARGYAEWMSEAGALPEGWKADLPWEAQCNRGHDGTVSGRRCRGAGGGGGGSRTAGVAPILGIEMNSNAERALSSVDGKAWWGVDVPFPFPTSPDPTVRRVVLGSLEDGKPLTLEEGTLAGLGTPGRDAA